jgi:cytochrome c oxidase subunit 1
MGAVFALFGGWYYWTPKLFGLQYNEILGQIHFWTLFIGVNITFFPMHFLGLQGMPRRISDYPDAFAEWNYIISWGSLLSVIATGLFIFIICDQLISKSFVSKNPWELPGYYASLTNYKLYPTPSTSLEWELLSPPPAHSFNMLPVITHSNFSNLDSNSPS